MLVLSKRLVIAIAALPMMLSAAALSTAQPKAQKQCEQGCPLWGMEEMENFFNRPFPRMNAYQHASSIKESDKAYLISIDLPGMDKKDISIETAGNKLIVSGERKEESDTKENSKRSFAQFYQSYILPEDANFDAISATSANGVLKITVPKTGTKKVSKKIEIK